MKKDSSCQLLQQLFRTLWESNKTNEDGSVSVPSCLQLLQLPKGMLGIREEGLETGGKERGRQEDLIDLLPATRPRVKGSLADWACGSLQGP